MFHKLCINLNAWQEFQTKNLCSLHWKQCSEWTKIWKTIQTVESRLDKNNLNFFETIADRKKLLSQQTQQDFHLHFLHQEMVFFIQKGTFIQEMVCFIQKWFSSWKWRWKSCCNFFLSAFVSKKLRLLLSSLDSTVWMFFQIFVHSDHCFYCCHAFRFIHNLWNIFFARFCPLHCSK